MFAWLRRPFRQRRRTTTVRRLSLDFEALEDRCQPSLMTPGFGQLPLSFEINRGQADSSIDFLSRGRGYSLGLSSSGAALDLHGPNSQAALLRMSFPGASSATQATGLETLPGKSNYFLGSDPSQWITDIATFGKVKYAGVYPGIDLVYYGNQQQLEFDFVVAPGADPNVIALAFQGADGMALDGQGNLVLHTQGGDVIEQAPVLYQDFSGVRHPVSGRFVLEGTNQVGFAVGAYDHSRPLIVDPVLAYASYLGGNTSDEVTSVAVDGAGNIYLGGRTDSDSFPLGNPVQNPLVHGFIAKMDPSGTSLIYSAYVGAGTGGVTGIAVDGSGNAYATGFTGKTSGFATAGAAQTSYGGNGDAFALKLNAAGNALVYATYIGGEQLDTANGIAVDGAGNAYVTGFTTSTLFPTHNALQNSLHVNSGEDAFVTKINSTGSQFLFSTYLGGNQNGPNEAGATFSIGHAITLDAAANVYVTGFTEAADFATVNAFQSTKGFAQDAFVTELKSDGSQILYSTFLGGPGQSAGSGDSLDIGNGIAVDAAGNILVTGDTTSQHFPVKNALRNHLTGLDDPFVTKLNPHNAPAGQLVYSTYLGGSAIDIGYGIAVDAAGNAYVTGSTNSHLNFPLVNPIRARLPGGGFMAKLTPSGTVVFNSYFGGGAEKGEAVAVDGFGNVVFVGNEFSTFLPTTPDAFQHDFPDATDSGFVAILRGGNKSYSGHDEDTDPVSVHLTGPGMLSVVRDDPDGDGTGTIKNIFLRGTSAAKSVLTITVGPGGDAMVDIGSIQGSGLLRISASHADLVGAGINLTGRLGSLRIHDLKNGADVIAAALPTQSTSIRAHDIGNGTTINTGGIISLLSAAQVGNAVIQAPKLTTLTVTGDFGAAVTLTGTGFAISTATIGGTVSNADFEIQAGSVDTFRAGAFLNSTLFIGVGGNLTPGLKINSFQATGFAGLVGEAFVNSTVAASIVGKVTLASVDTSNGNVKFGVHGHERIGSVRVTNPAFVFGPSQPTPQGIGDFEVKLV